MAFMTLNITEPERAQGQLVDVIADLEGRGYQVLAAVVASGLCATLQIENDLLKIPLESGGFKEYRVRRENDPLSGDIRIEYERKGG